MGRLCARQRGASSVLLLLLLLACAAVFVWSTGRGLPRLVAAHFDIAGLPTGYMPRSFYLSLMLALVVGLPLILVVGSSSALRNANARLNVPNRSYWLAPQRRAETIQFMLRQFSYFALMLAAFLCYGHWLVVQANASIPPMLPSSKFTAGLVVFAALLLIWMWVFFARFRVASR